MTDDNTAEYKEDPTANTRRGRGPEQMELVPTCSVKQSRYTFMDETANSLDNTRQQMESASVLAVINYSCKMHSTHMQQHIINDTLISDAKRKI